MFWSIGLLVLVLANVKNNQLPNNVCAQQEDSFNDPLQWRVDF